MNIYDTKVVFCSKCRKPIGEIEFDASVISHCGYCAHLVKHQNQIFYSNHTKIGIKSGLPAA